MKPIVTLILGVWTVAGIVSVFTKKTKPITAALWFSIVAGVGYTITHY